MLRKNSLHEGHGFHGSPGQVSRAVKSHSYEGFSCEVRLWGIPDEIGQQSLKNRTSGTEEGV
jgi:hypothetical protein